MPTWLPALRRARRAASAPAPVTRPHRDWDTLPAVARTLAAAAPSVVASAAFRAGLATTWQQPGALQPLEHLVGADAPSATVPTRVLVAHPREQYADPPALRFAAPRPQHAGPADGGDARAGRLAAAWARLVPGRPRAAAPEPPATRQRLGGRTGTPPSGPATADHPAQPVRGGWPTPPALDPATPAPVAATVPDGRPALAVPTVAAHPLGAQSDPPGHLVGIGRTPASRPTGLPAPIPLPAPTAPTARTAPTAPTARPALPAPTALPPGPAATALPGGRRPAGDRPTTTPPAGRAATHPGGAPEPLVRPRPAEPGAPGRRPAALSLPGRPVVADPAATERVGPGGRAGTTDVPLAVEAPWTAVVDPSADVAEHPPGRAGRGDPDVPDVPDAPAPSTRRPAGLPGAPAPAAAPVADAHRVAGLAEVRAAAATVPVAPIIGRRPIATPLAPLSVATAAPPRPAPTDQPAPSRPGGPPVSRFGVPPTHVRGAGEGPRPPVAGRPARDTTPPSEVLDRLLAHSGRVEAEVAPSGAPTQPGDAAPEQPGTAERPSGAGSGDPLADLLAPDRPDFRPSADPRPNAAPDQQRTSAGAAGPPLHRVRRGGAPTRRVPWAGPSPAVPLPEPAAAPSPTAGHAPATTYAEPTAPAPIPLATPDDDGSTAAPPPDAVRPPEAPARQPAEDPADVVRRALLVDRERSGSLADLW